MVAMKVLFDLYENVNFVRIIRDVVVTVVVLITAVTLNGEWVVISAHLMRQYGISNVEIDHKTIDGAFNWFYLQDFRRFWIYTMSTGFGIYFLAGFFLQPYSQWYYYIRQKDNPETWKCQPRRWLPRELEIDEIKAGIVCLLVTNTWSSLIACYVRNQGKYSTVYYQWDEYGVLWWILQFPVVFFYQDYTSYWCHRLLHTPYLYKRYHSLHHRYKQPTAFSTTAVHPVELSVIQIILAVPLFTTPLHWIPFSLVSLNMYYNGIVAHSGIDFKYRWWLPFQPPAIFHDNHHQYYHVNFGLNSKIWDKLHGTYRRPDRVYNENIYYGRGKPIDELTPEEIRTEIEERENEIASSVEETNDPVMLEYLKSKATQDLRPSVTLASSTS